MENNALFKPFRLKSLQLKNSIVMAPMTRSFSPNGIPTADVATYYSKRAAGQVGLILSEGTVINRPASSNDPNVPHFYGAKVLAGWQQVINEVHQAGGKMGPQIWHMGIMKDHQSGWLPPAPFEGPSDLNFAGWAKRITGKATIAVGSIGLSGEFLAAFSGESSQPSPLDELLRRMDRGDFDLAAVGRSLLADPHWVEKIRDNRTNELKGFTKEALSILV